jgi:hydroxyacylglutathione hydrolase
MKFLSIKNLCFAMCSLSFISNTFADQIDVTKRTILKPSETIQLNLDDILLIDVRTQKEWDDGHIKGATHLPLKDFKNKLSEVAPDHNQAIVVYCSQGGRAIAATKYMNNLGYRAVPVVNGGYLLMLSAGHQNSK